MTTDEEKGIYLKLCGWSIIYLSLANYIFWQHPKKSGHYTLDEAYEFQVEEL